MKSLLIACVFSLLNLAPAFALAQEDDQPTPAESSDAEEQNGEQTANAAIEAKKKQLKAMNEAVKAAREEISLDTLKLYDDKIERSGTRAHTKGDGPFPWQREKFPWQLKCTNVDYRVWHGCLELRFFDPSARVYFDNGTDSPDEVDIFNDGALNLTVDLASIYFPWRLGRGKYYDSWSWGPVIGAGLGTSAEDSADGESSSDAPVVFFSGGLMLEYKLESEIAFAFEVGRSIGFSSDESFGDFDDTATYAGIRINVPLGAKQSVAD
ncbi:MAG: hypothetical protein AAF660_13420 [Pseudomonadota bacterium]